MAEFQRLRIDLSQTLDASAGKKIADPPGFSASVAKEVRAEIDIKYPMQLVISF